MVLRNQRPLATAAVLCERQGKQQQEILVSRLGREAILYNCVLVVRYKRVCDCFLYSWLPL